METLHLVLKNIIPFTIKGIKQLIFLLMYFINSNKNAHLLIIVCL